MKPIHRTIILLAISAVLAFGILVFLGGESQPFLFSVLIIPLTIALFIFFKTIRYSFLALFLFIGSTFLSRLPCRFEPNLTGRIDPSLMRVCSLFNYGWGWPISTYAIGLWALLLDCIFWFVVSYLLVKFLPKLFKRKKEELR